MALMVGRRHRLSWQFGLVTPTAIALATTYLSLSVHGIFRGDTAWDIVAIVTIGVFTIGSGTVATINGKNSARYAEQEADIREALVGAVFDVNSATGTDLRDINAIFLAVRWHPAWRIDERRYLEPTVRVELGAHEPSRVAWTKGKGVIGQAWEKEQVQFKDLRSITKRWADCGPDGWNKASSDAQMGLSFSDWEKTQGKYGAVIAACTRGRRGITGLMAINGPLTDDWGRHEKRLTELAILTAKTVSKLTR